MENPETIWLIGIAALVAGILIGVLAYRRFFAPKIREADQARAELTAAREELERFKTSVNQHFDKTSELVNDLTQNYARVYQHLAEGAQTLGDGRRFSNALEQQPGRVSIALDDASVVPEKPAEPAAAPATATATATATAAAAAAEDTLAPIGDERETDAAAIADTATPPDRHGAEPEIADDESKRTGGESEADLSGDTAKAGAAADESVAADTAAAEDREGKSDGQPAEDEALEPVVNVDALEEALEKAGGNQAIVTDGDATDDGGDRQRSTTH